MKRKSDHEANQKSSLEPDLIGPPTIGQLFRRFDAADKAWMDEIRRSLPGRAGDVRYTKAAQGEPGSPLRAAFERFNTTGDAWRDALTARRESDQDRDDGVER